MSDPSKAPSPEERLRQLLAEAVEPVEPGPGAEARLNAKIRARRRERHLPQRLRWAGATLGAAAVLVGAVFVVTQTGRNDGSSASTAAGSSATSSSDRAPQAAEASPPAAGSAPGGAKGGSGGQAYAPAEKNAAVPSSRSSSQLLGNLPATSARTPGGGDQLTLSGSQLTERFRTGNQTVTQSVTLPQVSAGARVLGVTQLRDAAGALMPVAFVRIGADASQARDTLVAVVGGKLTVLRLAGQPVVLDVTTTEGYACAGPLNVTSGQVTSYVVSGPDLVPAATSGAAAKPGANCDFT